MIHTSSTVCIPIVTKVPRHIAIIMDGNGRWAESKRLPRVSGHAKGLETVRTIIKACAMQGIKFLTLFAFSSENWRRPVDEVSFLMRLFISALEQEIAHLYTNNIQLRVVGDLSVFEPRIQKLVHYLEIKTEGNTGLILTIAANYGGRWDILQATRKIAQQCIDGGDIQNVNESSFAEHLAMAYAPEPDLFIRTGGEQRVSNFLLWQLAYTEFYFTHVFWPEFNDVELGKAISSYRERERRFGRTSAQLTQKS
ncbi:polyprenyl diphosphate synthase [Candidatus Vallotia lariciata]|uniref:polyprenyl diphosphate synthase n=1 Tax=Candidatus Vallotia laricis TaxID=2018052 RepID=UPI001D021953|nr:polyprenyl diphosphate synthase [Candidatus Vallotia lariciata]UDG83054.1 Ditrans,polycis-undecaprenyl-diphosphate synthase ((2E,6E)-farnesyl-diphosphate specific) [Candidatus Vallotia lariciata]